MRKRFALLWTLVILSLALMLPATTAAASYGKIVNTRTSCTQGGNRVNATFKLTKYSGFHATYMEISAWGQGYYGRWRNDYFIDTYYVNINTFGGYYFTQSFWYVDNQSGSSRIAVKAKIYDGTHFIASGKAHSAFCG